MSIRPPGTDKAPYLAALIANSWKIIANAVTWFAPIGISTPMMLARSSLREPTKGKRMALINACRVVGFGPARGASFDGLVKVSSCARPSAASRSPASRAKALALFAN